MPFNRGYQVDVGEEVPVIDVVGVGSTGENEVGLVENITEDDCSSSRMLSMYGLQNPDVLAAR